MPDVSGIAALDVLIGLFFLYFLLSIACSALNELVATAFNFRARTLEAGIRNLLADEHYAKVFFEHPRVRALFKKNRKGEPKRKPSYLPSRTFALTLLDTFAPPQGDVANHDLLKRAQDALAVKPGESLPGGHRLNDTILGMLRDAADEARRFVGEPPSEDLVTRANDALTKANLGSASQLPDQAVQALVRGVVADAEAVTRAARAEIDRFRVALERSFDEVMDRASGWYKRRTHAWLFAIALVMVGVVNADSFAIGERLWKDKALRAAVVAQANKAVADTQAECAKETPGEEKTAAEKAGACVDQVEELDIPLGWSAATRPDGVWGWAGKVIGLLVTTLALSLGAPFWFDLLGKVARLRGAGPPSPPAEAAPLPAEPTGKGSAY